MRGRLFTQTSFRRRKKRSEDADKRDDEGLDMERCALRLDSLEMYAFISSLQASSSMQIIQGVDGLDKSGRINWIEVSLLVSGSLATLGGIYVTVVFAMCVMYGKTALGLNRDETYTQFMENTASLRQRGFRVFLASLLLFCGEVVLMVGFKVPSGYSLASMIAACFLVWFGKGDCDVLMKAALPIFASKTGEKAQKFN